MKFKTEVLRPSNGSPTEWGIFHWMSQSWLLAFIPQIVSDDKGKGGRENASAIADNMTRTYRCLWYNKICQKSHHHNISIMEF